MVNVFDYSDYRKLLRDLYAYRKRENRHFSYRFLGAKAGFKSAGYFTNVLCGKCNLSLNVAYKLCEAFKLKKSETEYFIQLVLFNLAGTQPERKKAFDKLLSMKRSQVKSLDESQFELFSEWYYLAVREMLDFYRFAGDYKELARMVVPAIAPAEARRAIEVLEKVGMIRKSKSGYYEKCDPILTTPDRWQSQAITFYQYATLDLAKKAFDIWDRKWRDISTLTLSISAEEFAKIQEKLNQVQEEILVMAQNAKKADRVYQINFFSFPLSRIEEST